MPRRSDYTLATFARLSSPRSNSSLPGEVLGGFGRKAATALQLQVGASTTNS